MKKVILSSFLFLFLFFGILFAHSSYTGGYSGSPGKSICASSCHGGTSGTMTVTGFPSAYQTLKTYTITIKHSGGNTINNFNATTRIGLTSTVAGTFSANTNSVLYTGSDGGVYANPRNIDSAVFQWTAPAKGTGTVYFYAAAFQGTSASGQSKSVTLTASETVTGVNETSESINNFILLQNYPNPFNPTTIIGYQLPSPNHVLLNVYDILGREVVTLVDKSQPAGIYEIEFNPGSIQNLTGLKSGVYYYRLEAGSYVNTKKLVYIK